MGALDLLSTKELEAYAERAMKTLASDGLSPIKHPEVVTYQMGKSIGLRLGMLWHVDELPFEEFIDRIRCLTNEFVLGRVASVNVSMSLQKETRLVTTLSRPKQRNEGERPSSLRPQGTSERGSCALKAGFLSGILTSYLKREIETQEILCGEATGSFCQFETWIR